MFEPNSLHGTTTTTATTTTATTTAIQSSGNNLQTDQYFHDSVIGLNSETWNQVQSSSLPPPIISTTFTMDTMNYLPPLIENVENMVDEEVGDHGQVQELNSIDQWHHQQYPNNNFLFWDNIVHLGGEEQQLAPNSSSNMGTNSTTLSPFPSSSF